MKPAFRIATARLLVRPWRAGDRAAFAAMVADREMMRYVSGDKPWSEADVDAFLRRQEASLARDGACMGALCDRVREDEVLGVAGAQRLDRMDAWDVGWWVRRDLWGRGYATEVACALVDHVLDTVGRAEVYACIDPDNTASIRVAERCGLRQVGETTGDRTASWRPAVPILLYRADAEARRARPGAFPSAVG